MGFYINPVCCVGIVFVVVVVLLRMILIPIDNVGCGVIFEYRGFEGGWGGCVG